MISEQQRQSFFLVIMIVLKLGWSDLAENSNDQVVFLLEYPGGEIYKPLGHLSSPFLFPNRSCEFTPKIIRDQWQPSELL